MKFHSILILSLAATLVMGCAINKKGTSSNNITYNNPVIRHDCPDPTIIDNRARDGWFYVLSTRSGVNADKSPRILPVYRSKDLVNWTAVGDGFSQGGPEWSEKGYLWAPDVNYVDGKYIVYYAMGVWGDLIASASGVAVGDSPFGPFHDKGMIASYQNTGVKNDIDPNYFEDKGKKYFYWGSLGKGSGIWCAELNDDGLSINKDVKIVQVAGEDKEGAYLHKHNGKYYLFASQGSCCEGGRSTYHVVVGRSDSPRGPFKSKDGMSMLVNDGSYNQVVLHGTSDKSFVGTGHNAEIVTDDAGQDWFLYHTFWIGNEYKGRSLGLDKVNWDKDGWPIVHNGTPSSSETAPYFK